MLYKQIDSNGGSPAEDSSLFGRLLQSGNREFTQQVENATTAKDVQEILDNGDYKSMLPIRFGYNPEKDDQNELPSPHFLACKPSEYRIGCYLAARDIGFGAFSAYPAHE